MLLVVVISSSWAMLMFTPANCQDRFDFDVTGATKDTYSDWITKLRDELRDRKRDPLFGVPMLPAGDPKKKTYLYVKLKYNDEYFITLAIDKANVYIQAYSDSQNRARFVSDIPVAERASIFDKASEVIKLPFTGRYESIENYLGIKDRGYLKMSLKILGSRIKTLCDSKRIDNKVEGEFMLFAIQMVSEAVRFAYIERLTSDHIQKSFKPDKKMIELEKTWGKLSKTIAEAYNEIENMGLLNYVAPITKLTMQLRTENVTTSIGLKGRPGSLASSL